MKVSVVIPAFNEEKYIKSCLESVFSQTVLPDEVIVVNNNSKDKTAEIVKKFDVKLVNEDIQGMIPARNRGFDEAKYDIIARTDADVILSNDWIKIAKKNFEKGRIDGLSGPVSFYDLFKKPTSEFPSKIYLEALRAVSKGKRYLQGPNMILSKDIWLKTRNLISLDDKKVHEDLDLSVSIHKVGGIISYDEELSVQISARRIKSRPESFFIEYPIRIAKTLLQGLEGSF